MVPLKIKDSTTAKFISSKFYWDIVGCMKLTKESWNSKNAHNEDIIIHATSVKLSEFFISSVGCIRDLFSLTAI